MAWPKIFTSTKELEREQRRAIQRAKRQVESSTEEVQLMIKKQMLTRDNAWNEARNYLKNGQAAQAKRALLTVQTQEKIIFQLEKKLWVFKQYSNKMEMALADRNMVRAIGALCDTINIDPDQFEDTFANITEKLDEQGEIDRIWNAEYNRDISAMENDDSVQSVDDMMQMLTNEVAENISAPVESSPVSAEAPKSSILAEIESGEKELQQLLKNTQK